MIPRILLAGSDGDRSNYEQAVCNAGGEPVSCYCPPVDLSCDGLILCGGGDIDPARYGQEIHGSEEIDQARDEAEFAVAEAFLNAGKPILGICRGHQILNVVLGGTLLQDIGTDLHLFHRQGPKKEDRIHPIRNRPGSFLNRLYGPVCPVNSSHHQALDVIGPSLVPVAWSESGLVEGLIHTSLPVLSVQFHPERMAFGHRRPDTVDGALIFRQFLAQCQEIRHGG